MENNGFTNHPYCNPYRRNFPLLAENPLIYLDSAATAQKPACVLQAAERWSAAFRFSHRSLAAVNFPQSSTTV